MNFYDKVGDEEENNTIYMMFGRSQQWSDNENDVNFAPPYPDDSPDGQADAWTRSLGFVKIPKTQLRAVLPRFDWGDPELTNSLQFNYGDIVVTNTIPINQHPSALAGYMVYRCVDVPDIGSCSLDANGQLFDKVNCVALGGTWFGESSPGGQNNIPHGTGDSIDSDDGYKWEYLYTIPANEIISNVTREYIVVPFPADVVENRDIWGLSNEIQYDDKISRLIYSVGSYQLRFKAKLAGGDFIHLANPGNTGYRQIQIILNPYLAREDALDDPVKATDPTYLPGDLQTTSGEMIYMETRQPIIKAPDQVEEFSLIFQF